MRLIILFTTIHFLSFGQSENKIDSLILGKYKYTCDLSCYEIYTFLEDYNYKFEIWGDSTIYLGRYKLRKNKLKLTPMDSGKKITLKIYLDSNENTILYLIKRKKVLKKASKVYINL
jgi:hypothetical protein